MNTNSEEERQSELSTLESIYEHRLRVIQPSGLQKFEVQLRSDSNDSSCKLQCTISFEYTEQYPEEAPLYNVYATEGLLDTEVVELAKLIQTVIDRSLGYIMIFDILSEVQEKLNFLSERRLAFQAKELETLRRKQEMEEQVKFQGDRVTIESFLAWNTRFLAEIKSKQKVDLSEDLASKKLTGRELFLLDNRYDDSDLTFLTENAVDFDESLFADVGDLDLSDGVEDEVAISANV